MNHWTAVECQFETLSLNLREISHMCAILNKYDHQQEVIIGIIYLKYAGVIKN